ncbi:SMC-Scp complex subunit ScpB [Chrysiogenes arsenatis]|uniref:SMC-Scp complex subunit ScpB n=1 Tax=Chrysiogenes arsenatis TaxID=309797 RepID=UPI00041047DD|nr:SMC-Scp complex subunit ScpB [Chrysiogenes arsenatis]
MSSQQLTPEETPQALPEKHRDVLAFVEAALFAAEEPLTPARISRIIDMPGIGEGTVSGAIQHLKAKFTHGITLNEADGAYYFGTTKESGRVVSKVLLGSRRSRSSRALLETLAIIAYNQPATKSDVEAIRGVDSTSPVKRLLDKGLIAIAGRRESAGKPFLYTTTRKFLQTFGINNIGELPIPGDESEVFAQDEE